jgi:pimeloyl-ACP methyl ester carboxylesterase
MGWASGACNRLRLLTRVCLRGDFTRAGEVPDTQADMLRNLSPLTRIDRVVAPTLVLHGANDTNVPVIEAEQVVESLRKRGRHAEHGPEARVAVAAQGRVQALAAECASRLLIHLVRRYPDTVERLAAL